MRNIIRINRRKKAFRVIVCNIHPSTPIVEVGITIEEIGFSVRQVRNVLQKTTKNNLLICFVDLEPAAINSDIFNVTSLLHTKVKIEEPHKHRDIIQCLNCQDYGHSKRYCSYSPRCVRCGEDHPSTHYSKTSDSPTKCALCIGDHPTNYKGCQTYKKL
ncbi:Pre-C2HC domain,Zinc finger, CCHC-type [Cinara cedri]|uniref:Pre-C2HC domain,Zinc finger, CCHC-type n=1 Tax=Cinara cedri TaxID=506608 RepID=A0A5E4M5B1_9HEMI|nr:Pre-C2HC domain,Zinc finger, CCHC-type [Cinara cedri]